MEDNEKEQAEGESQFEQVNKRYSSLLKKIIKTYRKDLRIKDDFDKESAIETLAYAMAEMETGSLLYTIGKESLYKRTGLMDEIDIAGHNTEIIYLNMMNASEELEEQRSETIRLIQELANETADMLWNMKDKEDSLKRHYMNKEDLETRLKELETISEDAGLYVNILQKAYRQMKEENEKPEQEEHLKNIDWVAKRYKPQHILNTRVDLIVGSYKKLAKAAIEIDEDMLDEAFSSIDTSSYALRVIDSGQKDEIEPGIIASTRYFIKKHAPNRTKFYDHWLRKKGLLIDK